MSHSLNSAGPSRRARFASSGSVSESESESESGLEEIIDQKDAYYDPVYFDTDDESDAGETGATSKGKEAEDQDDDEKDYDRRAGLDASSIAASQTMTQTDISAITTSLKQSSLDTSASKKSGKKQRHKMLSNAELLYDPDEDDRDENWLIKKIAANRPKGCKPEDIWTDAILSCPMCMTMLCFDCQQHEYYSHQFRAMFVENCRTIENEILRFPNVPKKPSKKSLKRSDPSSAPSEDTPTGDQSALTGERGAYQELKLTESDRNSAFHPVACEICNTKVAVVDEDEIYHFFNVIPTAV